MTPDSQDQKQDPKDEFNINPYETNKQFDINPYEDEKPSKQLQETKVVKKVSVPKPAPTPQERRKQVEITFDQAKQSVESGTATPEMASTFESMKTGMKKSLRTVQDLYRPAPDVAQGEAQRFIAQRFGLTSANQILKEGLMGEESWKFKVMGIKAPSTTTQTESGDLSYQGSGIINIAPFEGLQGKEFQNAVTRRYISFFDENPDVADVILGMTDMLGYQTFVEFDENNNETPFNDIYDVMNRKYALRQGDSIYTTYEDRNADIPFLVLMAKHGLEKYGKDGLMQRLASQYTQLKEALKDPELEKLIKERLNEAQGNDERTWSDTFTDLYNLFTQPMEVSYGMRFTRKTKEDGGFGELYGQLEEGSLAFKIAKAMGIDIEKVSGKDNRTGEEALLISEKDSELISKMFNIARTRDVNRVQNSIQKYMDSPYSSKYIYGTITNNPLSYQAVKMITGKSDEEMGKFLKQNQVSDLQVGGTAVQVAPAFIPYIGTPYVLTSALGGSMNMPEREGKLNFAITAGTLGLGKAFGSKLSQSVLGKGISLIGETTANTGGALGMIMVNFESYQNEDGSTNWGKVALEFGGDVLELFGRNLPQGVKTLADKSKGRVDHLNLFYINESGAETKYYTMVRLANGLPKFIEVKKSQYELALKENGDKPLLVQGITQEGVDTLKSNNPDFRANLRMFVGEGDTAVEFKTLDDIKVADDSMGKGWHLMDVLADPDAPQLHKTQIMGDAEAIMSANKLVQDGFMLINENGFLQLTQKGRDEHAKYVEQVNKLREEIDEVEQKIGKGGFDYVQGIVEKRLAKFKESAEEVSKVSENKLTKQIADDLADNPYRDKYLRQDKNDPIRITPSQLVSLSEQERVAIKYGLATGKLEMMDDVIVNKPYIEKFKKSIVDFGRDREGQVTRKYFTLGKALSEGNESRAKAIRKDLERLEGEGDFDVEAKRVFESLKDVKEGEVIPFKRTIEEPEIIPEVVEPETPAIDTAPKETGNIGKVNSKPARYEDFFTATDERTGRPINFHKVDGKLYRLSNGLLMTEDAIKRNFDEGKFLLTNNEDLKILSPELDDLFTISESNKKSNIEGWNNRGLFKPDNQTTINLKDFFSNPEARAIQSGGDDTRFYVNERFMRGLGFFQGKREAYGSYGGVTLPNSGFMKGIARLVDAKESGRIEQDIINTLPESEVNTLVKFIADLPDSPVDFVVISPSNSPKTIENYSKHEGTHKSLLKNTSGSVLPYENLGGLFSQPHASRTAENLKREGYGDNLGVLAQEVVAYATDESYLPVAGIKTKEDLDDFVKTYTDIIEGIADQYGEDAVREVTKYSDSTFKRVAEEILNGFRDNERRFESPQRRGQRRFRKTGYRENELSIKAGNNWKGNGRHRIRIKRFTPTGNPFDLTGIGGAEDRLRQGGKPTYNFYVQRPDGTYIVENQFENTKLLSYETEGDFNLVDMSEDFEARQAYSNMNFADFQKYMEDRGFDGFFNGDDFYQHDAFRFRVALFDNDVVKAKIKPAGEVKPQTDLAIKARQSEIGFYSAVEEATYSPKFPKKATKEQYLNLLKGSDGVRKEELEWSGVEEFLAGEGSITIEELRSFVEQGGITLEEVQFGGDTSKSGEIRETRYSQDNLQTSGERTNDVEILLKMPQFEMGRTSGNYKESELPEGYSIVEEDGTFAVTNGIVNVAYGDTRQQAINTATLRFLTSEEEAPRSYLPPHFSSERNLLAHLRGNERTIDGKRAFLLEEVQSDLSQQYYGERQKQVDLVDRDFESIARKMEELGELKIKC